MSATGWVLLALGLVAGGGLLGAGVVAVRRRGLTGPGLDGRTAMARAGSYAALALVLGLAVAVPRPGVALLLGVLAAIGLAEWSRLFGLPSHHRVVLQLANVLMVAGVYVRGPAAAEWLVGGLVLVGVLWPVVRADTGRAVRDLGLAVVGFMFIAVLLVHGVALVTVRGEAGAVLLAVIAAGCAGADVGAFVVGRRFGRTPLAPQLSPAKTRAGLAGGIAGGALALAILLPALVTAFPASELPLLIALLVPIVAFGSVWGDLFESAAKREAGVKDAATWLPGFGGILDRIDSLLIALPLGYWATRLLELARGVPG